MTPASVSAAVQPPGIPIYCGIAIIINPVIDGLFRDIHITENVKKEQLLRIPISK